MLDNLKALWGRLVIHWHVVLAAFIAALPAILDQLGVIDLRPILGHFMPEQTANFIVAVLPSVLAFLKPMLVMEPSEAAK